MEAKVRENILSIIKKTLPLIKKDKILELKNLSNHTLHSASVFQDEYNISIAVLVYSLSKIFERTHYRDLKTWKTFYKYVITDLEKAQKALAKNDINEYKQAIRNLFSVINRLDPKLSRYIKEVIEKAKINKASRIHEHGISTERTAELLGISQWELMDYVGKTGISDTSYSITKNVKDRLKITRSLFK